MKPESDLPALSQPSISIVICNYNYAHYIGEALDSALLQTYPASEIVIVDDGSTDPSLTIIRRYEAAHDRIRVLTQANGGQIAAYNTGFKHARGDVILFLDSDDLLLPTALEQVSRLFGKGVAKVHFRLRLIGPTGNELDALIPSELAEGHVAAQFLSHGVPHASPPASGNAYRRKVLEKIFPLPSSHTDRHGADFFCIYGATLFGDVAACADVQGLYRIHQFPRGTESLTFGNAEKGHSLDTRLHARLTRFSDWIEERTQGAVRGPRHLLDFSVEKTAFATAALAGSGFWADLLAGLRKLPKLLQSIAVRKDFSIIKKIGLISWAGVIILSPKFIALPAARYVCDPGSRAKQKGQAT
jgi:hypothetical protein